jgi:hypothetical protein
MRKHCLHLLGITVAFIFAVISTPCVRADTFLYGSTGDLNSLGGGRLYRIDVTTHNVTLIGNTGFDRLGGIAFNSSGFLYGVSGGSSSEGTHILTIIDPYTGAANPIGPISIPNQGVDGLRFNAQDVLYGSAFNFAIGVGRLVTINPANGNILSSLTLTGSGNSACAGIAFNPAGTLYASRGGATGRLEDIDLVDQVTGVLTPIGGLATVISDIAFALDGIFYGCSPNGDLYSINPVNGNKTFLFNTGVNKLSGLASPLTTQRLPGLPRARPTPAPRP